LSGDAAAGDGTQTGELDTSGKPAAQLVDTRSLWPCLAPYSVQVSTSHRTCCLGNNKVPSSDKSTHLQLWLHPRLAFLLSAVIPIDLEETMETTQQAAKGSSPIEEDSGAPDMSLMAPLPS
jgi:hypothetical protein